MEIIDELSDDCYVLTAKGVLVKCLADTIEMSLEDILEIADYCVDELYTYASSFTKGDDMPAIIFVTSKNGEFISISDLSEKGGGDVSEPTEVFAAAFIKMQSELPEIEKDSKADAGRFSYKYASLPEIFRVVKPVLHRNGFGLTQTSSYGYLVTTLHHVSGESLKSSLDMPSLETMSPQDYGKVHSYYRRYEVNGMLGLAPDEDVDAGGVLPPKVVKALKEDLEDYREEWTSPAPVDEVIADKDLLIEQAKENFVTIREAFEEGPVWHRQILANYCDTKLEEGEKIGEAITTRMSIENLQKLVDSQKVKIKSIGRK